MDGQCGQIEIMEEERERERKRRKCEVTSRSECVFQAVRQAVYVLRRQIVIKKKRLCCCVCEGKERQCLMTCLEGTVKLRYR